MDGSSDEKRAHEQNIPLEDIDAAARARGTTRAKVLREVASGAQSPQDVTDASKNTSAEQGVPHQDAFSQEYTGDQFQGEHREQQDGYHETQGADYGQPQTPAEQRVDTAQEGYNPTHSGVRHAQNQPGTRPPAPGRETGTSWGEDQQMGATTDTPDRKNPSG